MLARLEQVIWGWPLLLLILGTGLLLTLRLRFLPFRKLPRAMGLLFSRGRKGSGVSPFGAFCTAMSATIGTGNLVGVATALALGGPGALLWMELSAVTGMAVKYAEGLLAVKYRFTGPNGEKWGGPFAYILLGLGQRWKPLAVLFALFGALAGLCGVGTFVQIGSFTACLRLWLGSFSQPAAELSLLGKAVPLSSVLLGPLLAGAAGVLIVGGIRRISRASSVLVPLMGGLYLFCCLWILCVRLPELPRVLGTVLREAVRPRAAFGGLLGAVQAGVSRGVFSNEAGVGTAPIAAAAADTPDPVHQGLISMTAAVFDTLLICTLTGLVILLAGTWQGGVSAVMDAFACTLPLPETVSRGIVVLCLGLFSFTTVVSWSYYGFSCLRFLTGDRAPVRRFYLAVYLLTAAIAPIFSVRAVWMAANVCNGLMAVPNLIAILCLQKQVILDSRDIMEQKPKKRVLRKEKGVAYVRAAEGHHPPGRRDRSLRRGSGSWRPGEDRPPGSGHKVRYAGAGIPEKRTPVPAAPGGFFG